MQTESNITNQRVATKLRQLASDLEANRISVSSLRETSNDSELLGIRHGIQFSYLPVPKPVAKRRRRR